MDKNGYMSMWSALAWGAWRTERAADLFAGPAGAALWARARAGQWPAELGKPRIALARAERDLRKLMKSGALTSYYGPDNDPLPLASVPPAGRG